MSKSAVRSIVASGALALACASLILTGCETKKKPAAKPAAAAAEPATAGSKPATGGAAGNRGLGGGATAMAAMNEEQQRQYKDFRDRGDRAISVMNEVVDIIEANTDDCGKMAEALTDLVERRKEDIARGKRVLEDASEERRLEWATRQEIEFLPLTNRLVPALQKCRGDAKVGAVLASFRSDK